MSNLCSTSFFRLFLAFCLIAASACGKYGSPLPPEDLRPAAVRDVRFEGSADGLKISWLPPSTKLAGAPLDDLDGFTLGRALVVDGSRRSFEVIARVRFDTESGVSGLNKRMVYQDRDLTPGLSYDYVLQAYNKSGRRGAKSGVTRVKFRGSSSDIEILGR